MRIDLSEVSVVDNHCHGIYLRQPLEALSWRARLTESTDAELVKEHVPNTIYYRRLLRDVAAFLGCAPTEDAVLRAKSEHTTEELIRMFLRPARIEALLIDQGIPPRSEVVPDDEVARLGATATHPILRLETFLQDMLVQHESLAAVTDAFAAGLNDLRGQGYVALKSIVAYRTGLDIQTWSPQDVAAAFSAARSEVLETGAVRVRHKPLIDAMLHVALSAAARQEIPIQFHTGYGDTDTDLRLGDPLHLRSVLENPAYRTVPIVMLHESYPYTRKAAYLATVYGNAYLDLSYGIPFIGFEEMVDYTRAALSVAPVSKLLYSSDAVGLPEIHWASAVRGREAVGDALGALVGAGECSLTEAETFGHLLLSRNARKVYGLQDMD